MKKESWRGHWEMISLVDTFTLSSSWLIAADLDLNDGNLALNPGRISMTTLESNALYLL